MRLRAADYAPRDPGWLTIQRTKNREVKRLPVPDELADSITLHLPREARLEGRALFTLPYCGRGRHPVGPWTSTSLRRTWRTARAVNGIEIRLYEGTKRSRATDLLRQGVSERVLQVLLGHRDARSTRRYARLADEALVAAIRTVWGLTPSLRSCLTERLLIGRAGNAAFLSYAPRPANAAVARAVAVVGAIPFALQTAVLDALVWPAYFSS